MLKIRNIAAFVLLGFVCFPLNSQEIKGTVSRAKIINSDTVPVIDLRPLVIVAPMIFENRREERRYSRLVRNVKVVYPFAKLAGIKFQEYSAQLEMLESQAEKRRMMRQIERELLDEFEGDIRKLTFSQGRILLKLIDRETKHTPYNMLREFRGVFNAVFWQSIGRIFGYDLRVEYDPYGEDKMIEHIIIMIEAGVI